MKEVKVFIGHTDNDMLTLRLHGYVSVANEDLDLLHGLRGVAAGRLQGANKDTIGHGLGAVTREKVEAVIHVCLGGAVVKGGDGLALHGADWVTGLPVTALTPM